MRAIAPIDVARTARAANIVARRSSECALLPLTPLSHYALAAGVFPQDTLAARALNAIARPVAAEKLPTEFREQIGKTATVLSSSMASKADAEMAREGGMPK